MKHRRIRLVDYLAPAFLVSVLLSAGSSFAQQPEPGNSRAMDSDKSRVIDYWTQGRRDSATPRDFVVDPRGLGYLRRPDGSLEPYGHQISAEATSESPRPLARPQGGNNDTTPPLIGNMIPGSGALIGASETFSATVTDASGVRSVSFIIRYPDGVTTQTFQATGGSNDTWSVTLQGFTDGSWSWRVEARDGAKKGGNKATSDDLNFLVDTGGGGGGGSTDPDTITNAVWTTGGVVGTAAGRIYFEMPNNAKRKGPWSAFVCSGTVVTDDTTLRSVILTAAHCVYDDVKKAYARNVLFIPDQAGTNGSGTDLNCDNDPLGCWVPSFGVVDVNWTTTTFPNNIEWDYAYYVVNDTGAHSGFASTSDSLDVAAQAMPVSFLPPYIDDTVPGASSVDFTHALGYSYSEDPKLMYCAEDMTTEGAANWWLPSCGLSGGSSGGPWVQLMDLSLGSGDVISVNSWGYSNSPGMAGPKLAGTSAECVFTMARTLDWSAISDVDGEAGWAQACQ